jgi:hypothetical protein
LAAGWRKIDSSVCSEMSLARKFSSVIFSIKMGRNSFSTLLMMVGDTSVPQTGGASAVERIFSPM